MAGTVAPACWRFGPGNPSMSTCWLLSSCWVRPSLGNDYPSNVSASSKSSSRWTPWYFFHRLWWPQGDPQPFPVIPGHPPRPAGRPAQAPMESLLCSWVLACMRPVCTPWEWSLCFPQSRGARVVRRFWPSEPNALKFLLLRPDHETGKPDMVLRTLTPARWSTYL